MTSYLVELPCLTLAKIKELQRMRILVFPLYTCFANPHIKAERGHTAGYPSSLESLLSIFNRSYTKRNQCNQCSSGHGLEKEIILLLVPKRIGAGIINKLTMLKRSTHWLTWSSQRIKTFHDFPISNSKPQTERIESHVRCVIVELSIDLRQPFGSMIDQNQLTIHCSDQHRVGQRG